MKYFLCIIPFIFRNIRHLRATEAYSLTKEQQEGLSDFMGHTLDVHKEILMIILKRKV